MDEAGASIHVRVRFLIIDMRGEQRGLPVYDESVILVVLAALAMTRRMTLR